MITRLSQFAGNLRTLSSVTAMLTEHRVPQTLVIEGPVGSGRKTLARLLAAGLLCEEHKAPCGGCEICRLVQKNAHSDVTFVTPAEGKAAISVGQIRDVRMDAFVLPGQGNRKVFVVDGTMNDAAQNAFLKILEEPPAGVYFILLCGHRSELIDTVISRSVVLTLGPVTFEEAMPVLTLYGVADTPGMRADFARGGRLIGGLLNQNSARRETAALMDGICGAIANGRREAFLQAVAPAVEDRTMYPLVLADIYTLVRDALVHQSGVPSSEENVRLLAHRLTKERLLSLGQLVAAEQKKLQYNPNGWLFFTALCAAIFPRR